jgi:peptide chain release factor
MICWLQITSGRGPDECCWVVARVVEEILKDASANGHKADVLEIVPGERSGVFQSALIAIDAHGTGEYVSQWEGTIQWTGKSMFRPRHKRKNWFVGVTSCKVPEKTGWDSNDFKFETMRSSGPGGQHTNKTESAVRVTHFPTGLNAVAQEERSQHLNRKLALSRLMEKLEQKKENSESKSRQQRWTSHNSLERGNPVRIYEGLDFRRRR